MLFRPWRVLAGVWFGLGLGTKWSTVFVIAAFGLLVWAWDAGARRRIGVRGSVMKAAVVDALPAFGWLVLLPAVIYVATWTGWLLHADAYEKALSNTQYGPYWGNYLRSRRTGSSSTRSGRCARCGTTTTTSTASTPARTSPSPRTCTSPTPAAG